MTGFRVNMAMVMVGLVALAGVMFAFLMAVDKGDPTPLAAEDAFLPPGKVRHMIYTGTYTYTTGGIQDAPATEQHREEFWLVAGESHPLMRGKVTTPITAETWLEEDAYYEYEPEKSNEVRKRQYDLGYLSAVLPDPEIITKTLKQPNARLVGDGILDGRPVVIIVIDYSEPTPPAGVQKSHTTNTVTYWIDRRTNQILQVVLEDGGPQGGSYRQRTVNRIALDELIDRSKLPADFFEFKLPPGATLVEGVTQTPTPSRSP
jgi:hypothetical protein